MTDLNRLYQAWLDFKRENRLPDDLGIKFGFAFGLYDFETGTFRKPGAGAFGSAAQSGFGILTEAATLDPSVPGYVADMTGGAFSVTLPEAAPVGSAWEIANNPATPWDETDRITLERENSEHTINGVAEDFDLDLGPDRVIIIKASATNWIVL